MTSGAHYPKTLLFLTVVMLLTSCFVRAQKQTVIYPVSVDLQDKRDLYTVAVVKVIFSQSQQYHLQALPLKGEYDKLLALLKRKEIDIAWAGASKANTQQFNALNFPIMKGMIGYRLFLVKQNNQDILKNVFNLEDLKSFTFGQGSTWVEIDMFQQAGLQVVPSESYSALFSMLNNGRFELFPRSILEISNELETFSQYNLEVANHIALYYDFALLFYVNKDNITLYRYLNERLKDPVLKQRIDQLFEQYYQDSLDRYHYEQRRVIKIANPLMPMALDFDIAN